LIPHLDATTQARDAEALRVALGVPTLSWFAWTYGSLVAQTYAQLYPHRVSRMVIDSPLDHSVSTADYVRTQVRTTEDAFRRFVAWCDRSPDSCVLHGRDVAKLYDDLLARLARQPIPVPGVDHPITSEELSFEVMYTLENGNHIPAGYGGWIDLAIGIERLDRGNTDGWATAYASTLGPSYYHPYRAVGCLDFPRQVTDYREFTALRREVARLAPHTRGASDSWDYVSGCLGWPYPSTAPRQPVRVPDAPPVLLIATRHNPLAPYPLAVRVADQIDDSTVLTYEGDAHIAYFNSPCVREHEQDYLITGVPPASGISCADGT
jgi:pimeloyl-ACP methyl ester carboxylesterase